MKTIKSFREYIERQELLETSSIIGTPGLDSNKIINTAPGGVNPQEDPIIDNKNQESEESKNKKSTKNKNAKVKAKPENTDNSSDSDNDKLDENNLSPITFSPEGNKETVFELSRDFLSLKGDNYISKVNQLATQIELVRNSFRNIGRLITADEIVQKAYKDDGSDPSQRDSRKLSIGLNSTRGKSLNITFNNWKSSWNIKEANKTKEKADSAKELIKANSLKSKGKAYNKLKDEDLKEEEIYEGVRLNKFKSNLQSGLKSLTRPFSTTSEISSGMRNKYDSSKVLTNINKKVGSVFNVNDEYLSSMYNKYKSQANTIINKESYEGIAYLDRAQKNLDKFNRVKKYIKNVDDETYLREISNDVSRALNQLEYLGSQLERLINNYGIALNKISSELNAQDRENKKILGSSRLDKAIQDYQERKASREELKQKALETAKVVGGKLSQAGDVAKQAVGSKLKELKAASDEKKEVKKSIAVAAEDEKNSIKKEYDNYLSKNRMSQKNYDDISSEIDKLPKRFTNKSDEEKEELELNRLNKIKALYIIFKQLDKMNNLIQKRRFTPSRQSELFANEYRSDEDLFSQTQRDYDDFLSLFRKEIEKAKNKVSSNEKEALKSASDDERKNTPPEPEVQKSPAQKNAAINFAKDFDDAEPSNIYDYAVMKAKKLRER